MAAPFLSCSFRVNEVNYSHGVSPCKYMKRPKAFHTKPKNFTLTPLLEVLLPRFILCVKWLLDGTNQEIHTYTHTVWHKHSQLLRISSFASPPTDGEQLWSAEPEKLFTILHDFGIIYLMSPFFSSRAALLATDAHFGFLMKRERGTKQNNIYIYANKQNWNRTEEYFIIHT